MNRFSGAIRPVFYLTFLLLTIQCTHPPRMLREYQYEIPQSDVLDKCRAVLTKLDYEVDLYASESNVLITKPVVLRRVLRRYNYVVYVQISDRIEIHVAAERSIFKRSSESSIGGSGLIEKQPDPAIPYSLQKKIFSPIHRALITQKFYPAKIIK